MAHRSYSVHRCRQASIQFRVSGFGSGSKFSPCAKSLESSGAETVLKDNAKVAAGEMQAIPCPRNSKP